MANAYSLKLPLTAKKLAEQSAARQLRVLGNKKTKARESALVWMDSWKQFENQAVCEIAARAAS
jgi:hypothetical protein